MMDNIIIRRAEIQDAELISRFNIELAKETEDIELDNNVVLEGVKAVITNSDKGFYLIAKNVKDKIVGQLMVTFEWSDWRNKYFWWIQSVYVEKGYRKQKIFYNLFRRLIEIAKSKKDIFGLRLYVEKHNEKAKAVYSNLGLKITPYEVFELSL
jgi:GNAT superfamily N-acetyltransferase